MKSFGKLFLVIWSVVRVSVVIPLGMAPVTYAAQKVVYPKKVEVNLDGMQIQGEVRNPGDFYFQRKKEESFPSLVKGRANFHPEMIRDVRYVP